HQVQRIGEQQIVAVRLGIETFPQPLPPLPAPLFGEHVVLAGIRRLSKGFVVQIHYTKGSLSFRESAMSSSLLDKRESRIRRMFGQVAPSYDLLNHLLSLNVDKYWRWRTTRLVPPSGEAPILDLCTGTGDLALAYSRAAGGRVPIFGADFCHEMLV